jgi:ATP-dependent DNA helicase RecG
MPEQLEMSLEARCRLLTVDEIYRSEDSSWLRIIKEDSRVERKEAGIHAKALSVWFSMWANTPPHGGVIVIGISDNGDILGTLHQEVKHMNELERTGDVYCPDARCEFKKLEVLNRNGQRDQLLLIRVHYNSLKVVRTTEGMAYVRRGGSRRELKEEEIREIQIEKGELSWERENTSLHYPDDFDQKAIKQFATSVIEKVNLEHTAAVEEILEIRHLGRIVNDQFIPNKACALLFGKDPSSEIPGCRIRFLRFDGKDEGFGEKYNAIKDQWIEGNIPSQLVRAEAVIEGQLREFSHLGREGKFVTSPEYPKPAWYEAVVNAVCHRSYNLKTIPVFIRMFDDRLEVESPGGFLPFVTPDNIYDCHHPRNPDLMNALYFLDYVKCAHEGTRRMRETMQELELPAPIFRESQISHVVFKVTLKNNVEHRKAWLDSDASKVVGEVIFKTLTEHEKRIINYVAEYGQISVTDAVRLTNKAWESCKEILMSLVTKGILVHVHQKNVLRDSKAHFVLKSNSN